MDAGPHQREAAEQPHDRGPALISESSGQKSEAMRAIIGWPNHSEPRNTSDERERGRDRLQEVHERAAQQTDDRAHGEARDRELQHARDRVGALTSRRSTEPYAQ